MAGGPLTTNADILAVILRRRIDGAMKRSLVGHAKRWAMGMDTVKLRGILVDLIRARIALVLGIANLRSHVKGDHLPD
jgi:hypothetical protein